MYKLYPVSSKIKVNLIRISETAIVCILYYTPIHTWIQLKIDFFENITRIVYRNWDMSLD